MRHTRLLDGLALGVEAIVVAAAVVNITVTFGNALVRFLLHQDFPWAADVWALLISIIAFLGAPAYFRRGSGMAYTALIDGLSGTRRQLLEAGGLAILIGVCGAALVPFPLFFATQQGQSLPILGIDGGFVAVWLGIGLVLLAVFALEKLARLATWPIVGGAAAALALAGLHAGLARGVASLMGFLPMGMEGGAKIGALAGLPVFMAAGQRDPRIPIEVARDSARWLRAAEVRLDYREYDTAHKMNANGMRDLAEWWKGFG